MENLWLYLIIYRYKKNPCRQKSYRRGKSCVSPDYACTNNSNIPI